MKSPGLLKGCIAIGILCLLAGGATAAEDLKISSIQVSDPLPGGPPMTCFGFESQGAPWKFKGNNDGALSPGERTAVYVQITNAMPDGICYLSGILQAEQPGVSVLSPDCYDGVNGVRYSVPIAAGASATNLDPFIVEVSQAATCYERLDFKLYLNYTTDIGPCAGNLNCQPPFFPGDSSKCRQEYRFSLPIYALTQNFYFGDEISLFPSMVNSPSLLGGATNGGDIGFYYNAGGMMRYGRYSLDGALMADSTDYGLPVPYERPWVLWNAATASAQYEAYFLHYDYMSGALDIYWAGPGWGRSGQLDPGPAGQVSATFNPDLKEVALLFEDKAAHPPYNANTMTFQRLDGNTKTLVVPSPPALGTVNLGAANTAGSLNETRSAIAYLGPDTMVTYGTYFVAWERHDSFDPDPAHQHTLEVRALRADTLDLLGSDTLPLGLPAPSEAFQPALAVDSVHRTLALAWVQDEGTGQREIYVKYYGREDLPPEPWSSAPQKVTESAAGTHARMPSLSFNNRDFFLTWFEHSPYFTEPSDTVWVKEMALGTSGIGWTLQSENVSLNFIHCNGLATFTGYDRTYLTWADEGDVQPGPRFGRMVILQPLDPDLPYNVDKTDDRLVGASFQASNHPSLASSGDQFILAYRWDDQPYTAPDSDVYVASYDADGTALSAPFPISISLGARRQPALANPVAKADVDCWSGSAPSHAYEVFWLGKGPDDIFGIYQCRMDCSGTGSPGRLTDVGDPSTNFTKFFGAALDSSGSGYHAVVFGEWKSGDSARNLYFHVHNHWGTSIGPQKISTSLPANSEVKTAAVAYNPSTPFVPWVVVWTEYSTPTNSTTLKMIRLNMDGTPYLPEVTLTTVTESGWSAPTRSLDVAINDLRIMVAFADRVSDAEVLSVYSLLPDGTPAGRRTLLARSGLDSVHISRTGSSFLCSWLLKGGELGTSMSNQYHFLYQRLDAYGYPSQWSTRIASPDVYMWGVDRTAYDFVVAETDTGAVAAYNPSVSSMGLSNIYLTMLGWNQGLPACEMFNLPPTVSVTGAPYSVEFGSPLSLHGAASDDELGDAIITRGWDLSMPLTPTTETVRTVDMSGNDVTVTPTVGNPYLNSPGNYTVSFLAEDRNGAEAYVDAAVTVTDSTGPTVVVNSPNGGETLRAGQSTTITWDGYDNYAVQKWDVFYCTNYTDNGLNDETWLAVPGGGNLPQNIHSVDWTVPGTLSATCRIKVVGTDASLTHNVSSDVSDQNFYIVQMTTTAIRTLILYHSARTDSVFGGGSSGVLFSKLTELANHTKVNGVILDLNNVAGLAALYSAWDASSLDLGDTAKRQANVEAANAVANGIRDYVVGQVAGTYTNAEYLVLAGDDRIIPFYRVADGTSNYPETNYAPFVNVQTPVGAAVDRKYYLTDGIFGDIDYEATEVGATFLALPDLATGRLVETPAEIATTVNAFIAQDGQINLNKVLVTGYDFLDDSASAMADTYTAAGKTVDHLITPPDASWGAAQMEAGIFSSPAHALASLNNHADHANFGTPGTALSATQIDTHAASSLRGALLYSVGCHSGLSAPDGQFGGKNPLDLPQVLLRKGAAAYVGNTGYGWGLKFGSGYSERLAEMITTRLLSQQSSALGKAMAEAKRDYFIQDHRYDVFDEKVLFESTLYGLPMYKVVMSSGAMKPAEDEVRAEGPDEQEAQGIRMKKSASAGQGALPAGVTELTLNFDFSAAYGSQVNTLDGSYWRLNGKCNAELGDSLQPYFTYDSRLSGTVSHGVLFTGGAFVTQSGFDPVVASPQSSTYEPASEGPLGPSAGGFIPTVNATHPQLPSSLVLSDLTRMTVSTGYFEAGPLPGTSDDVETKFETMNFVMYYSNSSDKTAPVITDPGETGALHTLNGLTATFSVPVTDASGIYRVVVVYTDRASEWKSMDLALNAASGKWEGSLLCKKNTLYHVQAVDRAGNVGYLKSTGSDKDGNNTDTGSTWVAGRLFSITLADTDGDGMPNAYETANGLNPNANDAGLDPDYDGLTNLQEFALDTLPQNGDTDGDGENDGSEVNHNGSGPARNPLVAGDGKRITIGVTKSGNDVTLSWPSGLGDNGVIDGPYWIYRSVDPFFSADEEMATVPSKPLSDGTSSYTFTEGAGTYYYTVTNVRYTGPPPAVVGVLPNHGHATDTVWILVNNLQAGASVTFGATPATNVSVINGTTLTCTVPAGSGSVRVTVTNPNGQYGYLDGAFTYDP